MENYILYGVILILFMMVLWLFLKKRDDKCLEAFMKFNNNISVITTSSDDIITINQAGLDFFELETVGQLLEKQKYLSKLFDEIIVDDTRYVEGKKWVTKIDSKLNIKVKMYKNKLRQVFHMQVTKVSKEKYLIVFYNISQIIAEKEEIDRRVDKDELTQVYNRTKFNKILTNELKTVEIEGNPFTLILIDIDNFKEMNDSHGNTVGDHILIALAGLIKSQLRQHDIFARWDGDEFIIFSKYTIEKNAYILAKRLRETIEAFSFNNKIRITCSFGITEFQTNDTTATMIKRANSALKQAKENGKNTICM